MSEHTHLIAARLCYHSYFHLSFQSTKTDVQVYTTDIKENRYLVFPGTFSVRDWITNLKFTQLISPYGDDYTGDVKLHCGYFRGYESVRDKLLKLADTDLNLIVTGHSAGGCLAQIAGTDINYQFAKKVSTITFGSPACGNYEWKLSANKRITNTSYANIFDPIPYILPIYSHVSSPVQLMRLFLNPHGMLNYANAIKKVVST